MNLAQQRSAAIFGQVLIATPPLESESAEQYSRRVRTLADTAARKPRRAKRKAASAARRTNRKA